MDYVRRTPPIIIEQRDLRLCLRTRVNRCARVRITSKKRDRETRVSFNEFSLSFFLFFLSLSLLDAIVHQLTDLHTCVSWESIEQKTYPIVGIQTRAKLFPDRQLLKTDKHTIRRVYDGWRFIFHSWQPCSRVREREKECISIMDGARYCCVNRTKLNRFLRWNDEEWQIYIYIFFWYYSIIDDDECWNSLVMSSS
jgi:hypothetical protein